MPKPIAVIAADTHIDEYIWRHKPNIVFDSYYGFQQAIGAAVKFNVPLILAGDVVETLPANTPTSKTVSWVRSQINRLKKNKLNCYAVTGQHDQAEPSWLKACHEHVTDADQRSVGLGKRVIYFLNWRPTEAARLAVADIPQDTEIIIAHQHWRELMGGGNFECSVNDLPHGPSLVVTGDLHQTMTRRVKRLDKEITFVSPGATHLRKTDEPDNHRVLLLHDDLTFKFLKIKSRLAIRQKITADQTADDLIEKWPKLIAAAMTKAEKIKLPPTLMTPFFIVEDFLNTKSYNRLLKVVNKEAHLFYYVRPTTDIDHNLTETDSIFGEVNTDTEDPIVKYLPMECPVDSFQYKFIKDLVSSESPRKTLDNYCDSYTKK